MHDKNRPPLERRRSQIELLKKVNLFLCEDPPLDDDPVVPGATYRARFTPEERALLRVARLVIEEEPEIFAFNRLTIINFAIQLLGLERFRPYLAQTRPQPEGILAHE